ncbi:hypothetical protein HJY41_05090 [Barnesiella sp. GGCC_0306]|jgi:hypothetical protein|nr:hypothetical protein [Barnesiella sp. GGCC_0306]
MSKILSVRNPAHWENAFLHIIQEEKARATIKTKVNPDVFNNTILIKGNQILRIKFEHT